MNEETLKTGDLVRAVFRPDAVGIVERVYGDNCEIVDVRRQGQPSWCNAPANAFVLVPACSVLYGIGVKSDVLVQCRQVVSDVAGLTCWINHTPVHEVAAACICRVDRHLRRISEWRSVAELLAEQSARESGIIK